MHWGGSVCIRRISVPSFNTNRAAEQGYASAQHNLGSSYFYGEGVPQDDVAAADCWRNAAEQGHAEAQYTLGVLYFNGWGAPQDVLRAEFWYRKAAEQGDAYA
jgi:TPR repeat protein